MIRSISLQPLPPAPSPARPLETVSPQEPVYPSKAELLACLPPELLKIDTTKAWCSLAFSLGFSLLAYAVGTQLPLHPNAAPLWLLYALVTGTVAGGCWVIAHECGHQAFHPNRQLEAAVGFVLHSLLLVPYFSWQRSHAVHHANCNQLEGGETHVPPSAGSAVGQVVQRWATGLGPMVYGVFSLVTHLLLGWPLYLLFGVAGGEDHGAPTSHFWHGAPFRNGRRLLFPDSSRRGMLHSNLGLVLMLLALALAAHHTSLARVLAVYGLPYLVINAWLVGYTWLQHTDTRIPHYNAWRGTALLSRQYPELVRFDPTPIHRALWRIASGCAVVSQESSGAGFYYQAPVAATEPSA